jgi:dTDP-4-dehydrorhamnose 3,5-epimerase
MHFQFAPYGEMKIVRCMRGKVWDVVLDLRKGSPTLLGWHAEELSPGNNRALVIPEGCAHGFQVLEPESELLYLHTAPYTSEAEGAVHFADPLIGIRWPLPVTDTSARDRSHPFLAKDFSGIDV